MTTSARFAEGGRTLLITMAAPNRRGHVLRCDLATDTAEDWLEADYGSIDPAWLADADYVTYPSTEGAMVPALVYRPAGWSPGERRPAIVLPHGGPTGQYFRTFDLIAQFLQDQGYVVLMPNVRGSTGYGVSWRDACLKDWGGRDLEDVAAGARYLAQRDDVDPERLGVLGGSYGGYLTYMAVSKTPDLFKVGIPLVGISDLPLLYEEDMEHFKYYLRQQMGDPTENAELWRERSATTYAHQVTAKLLIIHGLNDPRCPISQARVFRDLLLKHGKREGVDFEYHEFEEGHGSAQAPEARLRHLRLMGDFLARRL
jgi:dipeptidyl aminopeptidase/acylaminoacyl peptidase